MELSNLIFKVDTSQLEKAVKTIEQVGQATEDLAKNIQNLARAEKQSADASTASAKARQENAKATTAELKAAEAQANAAEKAAKATRDLGKSAEETGSKLSAAEKLVEKMNLRQQVLARGTIELNNEVVNLGRGFTSGQAAMIASLKQLGGGADMIRELATTLKQYNDITGVNPFDKAIGGMRKLTQEARELQLSSDLSAKGFALTKDQVQILARDLQALTSVYKQNGASQDYVNRAIDVVTKRFIRKAEVVNRLNAEVKENERAAKAQGNAAINAAKATSFIERELARAENALQGLNEQLYISTSNRLLKFQQSLAASNLPMEQQIALMERYKKTLAETDAQRRKQNTTDSNRQVDLLARSLAPQISDVAVSLAGGMNPFTVLMQQGLQVRDLMQLSGVEAERMGEAFRKAGAGVVSTSVAAAGAIGSMLGGAILDAGKSVVDFGLKIFGLRKPFNELTLAMAIVGDTTENQFVKSTVDAWLAVSKFIPLLAGLAVVLAGAGIASVLGATIAVAREQSALSKALATTGASLGLTKNQAVDLAASLNGITASKGVETLTEMAKAGGFTQEQFGKVAEAASKMSKFVGQDVATTVAQFKDLQKDPAEALAKLAAGNGLVEISVIKKVKQLQEDKKIQEAVNLATEAHAAALVEVAGIVESEMHPMTALWIDLKSAVNSVWEEIKALAATDVVMNTVRGAFDTVRGVVYDLWMVVKAVGNGIGGLGAIAAAVISGDFSGAKSIASSMMDDVQKGLEDREKYMKGLYDFERKADKQLNTDRKKNAQDAEKFIRSLKKSPKSDQEKAEEAAYKNYLKFVRDMKVQAVEAGTAQGDLTKAQEDMIKLLASDHWKNLSENNRQSALSYFYIANAAQEAQRSIEKAAETAKQAAKEAFESDAKRLDAAADYEASLRDSLKAVQDESVELQFQAGLIGLVDSERKKAIESRKIEIEYAKELKRIEALDGEFVDKDALKASALQKRNLQLQNLNTSIANDLNQKMVDGVTDAIMTGLIEGGEAGKKKLRDLIVAELQKPIRIFVQAIVSNIFGGGGAGGQAGGFMGAFNQLKGMYDAFNNFGSNVSGMVGQGVSMYGQATGNTFLQGMGSGISGGASAGQTATALQQMGDFTSATQGMAQGAQYGQMLNTGAGYMAGIGGGIMAGRAISGGYSAFGKSGNSAVNLGTTIGAFFGPWGALIGGAIGGLVNRAFGRKLVEQGIKAKVDQGKVNDVLNYSFEKGGWFKSDRTKTSAVDQGTVSQVTKDVEQIKTQALGMANALGLNAGAIESFSGELKINLKGVKSAEEASQRYSEGMQKLYVDMLNATGGLDQFRRSGETVEMALQRLTQEATNLAQQAGYSAEQITSTLVAGMTGKMSEEDVGAALGDIIIGSVYNALAMGFAEQITGAITGLIINPIMTAVLTGGSVSAAVSQASINAVVASAQAAINAFNQVISDPAFQSLISQINSMVGQVAKISVRPAANIRKFGSAMQSAGNAAAEAAKKIADERYQLEGKLLEMLNQTARLRQRELNALHPSNRALQMHIYALEDAKNAYDAVVDAVNDTLDKSKELKDRIKGIFDLLLEQIRELRGEVEDPAEMQRVEAQRFLEGVISSGILPDQEDLSRAIDALRSGIVDENFQSEVESARERLTLANTLDQIKSIADKDLKKTEQDILLLEQQLKIAQDQMNALLGIQTHTYDTQQAVVALQSALGTYTSAFTNAMNAVKSAMTSAPKSSSSGGSSSGGGSYGGGGGGGSGAASVDQSKVAGVQALYKSVLGRTGSTQDVNAYAASGLSLSNIALDIANSREFAQKYGSTRESAITAIYKGMLGRNPDQSGFSYYLQSGKSYGQIAKEISLGTEFQNRVGIKFYANGGAFTNGVVKEPTMFNASVMGESGPEAIMPLVNVGGSLGVRAVSGDSNTSKQLDMLSTAVMQLTIATNKMQRQFDNARGEDGTSLNVTIVNTSSNPVPTDAV